MSERFDVDRVRLRHYRSIAQCDVRLQPLNVIVGPNGAGKSNFVDSLGFVAQSLDENLEHALRDRGGMAEVRRRSTSHPSHFSITLNCHTTSFAAEYSFTVEARAGGGYSVTHEECSVVPHDVGGVRRGYSIREGQVLDSLATEMPRVLPDRLALMSLSGLPGYRELVDGLTGINVYSLNPEQMRIPQKPQPGDLLNRDGANIASVVENIKRSDPDLLDLIQAYLQRIVPGVESVHRTEVGGWEFIELKQWIRGATSPWTFAASSMSDGTLRALGVLVALLASGPHAFSPAIVEEPETALHPAAAGVLLQALLDASRRRQVLLTSHSPDLLDSPDLKPENLIAVRSEAGNSIIQPVDSASRKALEDQLFTAGELLRADQLLPEGSQGVQEGLF